MPGGTGRFSNDPGNHIIQRLGAGEDGPPKITPQQKKFLQGSLRRRAAREAKIDDIKTENKSPEGSLYSANSAAVQRARLGDNGVAGAAAVNGSGSSARGSTSSGTASSGGTSVGGGGGR